MGEKIKGSIWMPSIISLIPILISICMGAHYMGALAEQVSTQGEQLKDQRHQIEQIQKFTFTASKDLAAIAATTEHLVDALKDKKK